MNVIRNSPSQRVYLAIHKPICMMTYNCVNNTIIDLRLFHDNLTTFRQMSVATNLKQKRPFYVTLTQNKNKPVSKLKYVLKPFGRASHIHMNVLA